MTRTLRITRPTRAGSCPASAVRRGAMMPLVGITLPIMLVLAAFAVDLAYMQLVRTELRAATDAAARAGGRRLSMSQNPAAALIEARLAASKNTVAGQPLQLRNSEVEFGRSRRGSATSRWTFTAGDMPFNALRVNGNRTAQALQGPVPLFFGNVLGIPDFQPRHQAVSTQIDRDIALAIDRSGSMAYADNESSNTSKNPKAAPKGWKWGDPCPPLARWLAVPIAVRGFLDALALTPQDEYVAMASYSTSARLDQGMTLNYSLINGKIDAITKKFEGGATNIGDGMRNCITVLTGQGRPYAAQTIVLMTDGIWNRGTSPITVAYEAKAKGIVVHCVTFSNEADQKTMKQVAEITGGGFWHAPVGADLIEVFRQIANNNPTLLTE